MLSFATGLSDFTLDMSAFSSGLLAFRFRYVSAGGVSAEARISLIWNWCCKQKPEKRNINILQEDVERSDYSPEDSAASASAEEDGDRALEVEL